MHRATPLTSSFRAYVAGGARVTVPEVDDTKLMQESKGNVMSNESREKVEAPQNYGFTSVVADAMKDGQGKIQQCAETFVSFMGGNRSFPVFGNMDDRRHRLKNLAKDAAKGATAMFGMKEWGQQFLNTKDGMFMTGNVEKKMRFALVENQNGKTQQQKVGDKELPRTFMSEGVEFEIETFIVDERAGEGGGGGGSGGGKSKPTGQKTLHKEKSKTFVDVTKDAVHTQRGNGNVNVTDNKTTTHHGDDSKSTRCDSGHVHIRFSGAQIWVGGGCFSSQPITLASCSDGGGLFDERGRPLLKGGPAAHFTEAPLSINNDGTMSMAMRAPLKVTQPTEREIEARHAAMQAQVPMPHANGSLYLDIDEPLHITPEGKLSLGSIVKRGDDIYLGGDPDRHKFARIVTTDGPSSNVWARIE